MIIELRQITPNFAEFELLKTFGTLPQRQTTALISSVKFRRPAGF
jgi:hypothetical protein